jgi:hypothetical protein
LPMRVKGLFSHLIVIPSNQGPGCRLARVLVLTLTHC